MFNKTKKEYLSILGEKKQKQKDAASIFKKIKPLEEKFEKDVTEFSLRELKDLFQNINTGKLSSLDKSKSTLKQYVNYCVSQNIISDNLIPRITKDYLKSLSTDDIYVTQDQLLDWVNQGMIANDQDSAMVLLLFEGVDGEKELPSIKICDIDFENDAIFLTSTKRNIYLDKKTMEFVRKAIKQKLYAKKNGLAEDGNGRFDTEPRLIPSNYLIRKIKTNNTEDTNAHLIKNRLETLRNDKEFGVNRDVFTRINIKQSGRLALVRTLYERFGKWGKEEIELLNEIFISQFNEHLFKNYDYKKQFTDTHLLKKVYGGNIYPELLKVVVHYLQSLHGPSTLSNISQITNNNHKTLGELICRHSKSLGELAPLFKIEQRQNDFLVELYNNVEVRKTNEVLWMKNVENMNESDFRQAVSSLPHKGELKERVIQSRLASQKTIKVLKNLYHGCCQICEEGFMNYAETVVEAHHIEYFSLSQNHHPSE